MWPHYNCFTELDGPWCSLVTGGAAWPFSVGGVICHVISVSLCKERREKKGKKNEKDREKREKKTRNPA